MDRRRLTRWWSLASVAAAALVIATPNAASASTSGAVVTASDVPAPTCVKIVRTSDLLVNYKYTAENHCRYYQVRVQFKFRGTFDSTCKIIDYGRSASTSRGKIIPFDGLYNC
jgi:hypothetical protein